MADRMKNTALLAAAVLTAVSLGAAGAAWTLQATAPAVQPAVHTFKLGAWEAASLKDGGGAFPNGISMLWPSEDPKAVAAVLQRAGLPADPLELSINVLLVRTGDRVWLLDTGDGPRTAGQARPGVLPQSLARAGVQPAQVTDVVISHAHGDHIGGLVGADGGPAFPNAKVRMTAAEWDYMKGQANAAAAVKAISAQVETFQPGATLAPGITAVEVRGHTPGHTAVLLENGGTKVLAIGDTAHHSVISLREPEFTIAFDGDAPTAEASRRALMQRAAGEKLTVFAPHFPYPGLGAVRREGDGFVWEPSR